MDRGTCPVCGGKYALRYDGTLYPHGPGSRDPYNPRYCMGSQQQPGEVQEHRPEPEPGHESHVECRTSWCAHCEGYTPVCRRITHRLNGWYCFRCGARM